jgi:hypothetical protein
MCSVKLHIRPRTSTRLKDDTIQTQHRPHFSPSFFIYPSDFGHTGRWWMSLDTVLPTVHSSASCRSVCLSICLLNCQLPTFTPQLLRIKLDDSTTAKPTWLNLANLSTSEFCLSLSIRSILEQFLIFSHSFILLDSFMHSLVTWCFPSWSSIIHIVPTSFNWHSHLLCFAVSLCCELALESCQHVWCSLMYWLLW